MGDASSSVAVLHVDDDPNFADITSTLLERESEQLAVETVPSATAGLERLTDSTFDCVVSDYDMPDMDGVGFLERVREEFPDIPFILFTGKGSEEIAAEAISNGATDYIQKEGETSQYTVLANRIENVVERYRVRQRAERANRRRRRTLERITDGFTELDEDLVISDINEQTEAATGLSRSELIGTPYRELVPDEGPSKYLEAYRDVLDQREPRTVVGRSEINPDRWYEERIFPARDGGGIYIYFRDITQQKRREKLQRIIIENSSELINVDRENIDTKIEQTLGRIGEFEDADRSYVFEIYDDGQRMDNTYEWCAPGVATQQSELQSLDTESFSWFIPKILDKETVRVPDVTDLSPEASHLRKTLEAGDIRSIVTIPLTRTGEVIGFIGFDWTGDPEPWTDETLSLMEVTGNIIANALTRKETVAERKEREQTLSALHDAATDIGRAEREEQVYETLIDTAKRILEFDLVVVDIEEDGHLVQKMWSLAHDEGDYYEKVSLEEDDTFTIRAYNRQETIITDDVREYEITPADTEYRSALTVPIGEFGIFQTVSTRVDAFDEYDREFTELLVDHAQVKLTQLQDKEALRAQTAELKEKNERLDTFTSIVSHDLQSPLNTLSLSMEAAERTQEAEHFDRGHRAIERMERLLEDLLSLARQGEVIDDPEPVSLRAVTEEVWGTVETRSGRLDIESDVTVKADRTRLKEVLENLIRNALEHGTTASQDDGTDSGRAVQSVSIAVGQHDDGFYVADDGPGIPEEDRESVLETGYSTAEDGTGFGLAIVHEIVEAHGWELTVTESDEGGARFELADVTTC